MKNANQKKLIQELKDFFLSQREKDFEDLLTSPQYDRHPLDKRQEAVEKAKQDIISRVDLLVESIDDKDMEYLLRILHFDNKISLKFFEDYTGISLGRTNKKIEAALEEWSEGAVSIQKEKSKQEAEEKELEFQRKEKERASKEYLNGNFKQGKNLVKVSDYLDTYPSEMGAKSVLRKKRGRDIVSGVYPSNHPLSGRNWTSKVDKEAGDYLVSQHGLNLEIE